MFPIIMLSQHPDVNVQSCQTPKMCNYQLKMIMYKMPYATVFIPNRVVWELGVNIARLKRDPLACVYVQVNYPSVEQNKHATCGDST